MKLPEFVENPHVVDEDDQMKNYLLSTLPHITADSFVNTHKPNAHVVVNKDMNTLEVYLADGGMLFCGLIDVGGDTNPWSN